MVNAEVLAAHARAAADGDPDAVAEFIKASYQPVWRYLAHVTDRQIAEDLTQETFVRALRSLRAFRGDSTVMVWLLSIARRTAMDHFRAQGRRPNILASLNELPPDVHNATPLTPDPSGESDLRALIDHLEPARRAVFVLTQLLGFSYAEVAEIVGIPIGTVRSRVARAREDLAAMLTAAEDEGLLCASGA